MVTPVFQAQPSYSWVNRQAQVKKALVSGQNFLPLPGGYQPEPGSIPRGGQVPRITDAAIPTTTTVSNAPNSTLPTAIGGLFGDDESNPNGKATFGGKR